ncbi:hypothetical protein FHS72_003516 [Loktanella ponticola]|uniref:Porin n=1 Tax=Yoonia ponticola TaxID=1524255 RepID=A0A7W9BNW2_9RHOB|nr:hypothetical protein [Yoonia ponticola]MBB5723871.1 hypothetical protein [Yoonia ponticola]
MKILLSSAALILSAAPLYAQQFTGGELGFEYNQFVDDDSINGTNYHLGAEMAFNRSFSIAANVQNLDFEGDDTSATLHGIYHLNETSSLGVFVAGNGDEQTSFGFEGGTELWKGDIGGYIGQVDVDGETAVIFGLSSNTPIGANFSVFSDLDFVADDDVAVSTQELGVEYNITGGADIFAQVGQAEVFTDFGSDAETYVGIGARIQFGAARGTTFEAR